MTVKQGAKTAMPRLRFPGFRQAGGWTAAKLGELFTDRQETGATDLPLLSLMDKEGIVPQEETNRKDNSNADKSKYLRVVPGDIAYNTMRMWEGRSAYVDMEGLISPAYTVCAPNEGTYSRFFSYYFKTEWLISQFRKYSQGLVKDTLNLKFDNFKRVEVAYPSNVQEQQKIADCLTSLDEVIAAQGRKVEALKAHKRGLMQQLFPREGETRPRLRFPEFRDAPEWESVGLEAVCSVERGKFAHRPRNDPKFFNGPYPFIQTGDVVRADGGSVEASQSLNDLGLSVSKLFKPTIVLITIAANIGDTAILDSEACFTDSVVGLTPKNGRVTPRFLESTMRLQKERLHRVATTGAQKNINIEILEALDVLLPSMEEQAKIADCLASLDTRIAAETSQLTALKTHKQGLMQQLFPAPEPTTA